MLSAFALQLLAGMSWMLAWMPQRDVRSGFFRVQMLILLGLGVLAFLALPTPEVITTAPAATDGWRTVAFGWLPIVTAILSVLAFLDSVLWTLERRRAASVVLEAISLLSLAAVVLASEAVGPATGIPMRLHWWSAASSAALLGAAMTSMLLGHSYLTAPGMSLVPLVRLNQYLGWAVLVRAVLSAVAVVLVWPRLAGATPLTWLALRWLAGICGPAAMCAMVVGILKYKNTQSATGVLFVAVIFTFIGELTAALLSQQLQFPM